MIKVMKHFVGVENARVTSARYAALRKKVLVVTKMVGTRNATRGIKKERSRVEAVDRPRFYLSRE